MNQLIDQVGFFFFRYLHGSKIESARQPTFYIIGPANILHKGKTSYFNFTLMNISDIHIILQFIQITSIFDRFHHSEVNLTAAKYEHYIQWLDNNYIIMNCFFLPPKWPK